MDDTMDEVGDDVHYTWNTFFNFSSTEPPDFVNQTEITNETEWAKWYPVIVMIITSILLGIMILATIIGNFFVIAAVFFEKNLQNVANYLIVSLAVADLMVACLVMPLGAVSEIAGQWILGQLLCDMWTSLDVLCCTASILHLVAIAVDRFWAVTDIEYIRNRNRQRINTMIFIVWLVAAIVSLLPFLGWKDPEDTKRLEDQKICMVSQDVYYQIFATCATFYVPLFIILILYWKIWKTAQRRIRHRPGRIQNLHKNNSNSNCHIETKMVTTLSDLPQCSRETTEFSINPSPSNLTPTTPTIARENTEEITTISKLVESVSSPSIEVTLDHDDDEDDIHDQNGHSHSHIEMDVEIDGGEDSKTSNGVEEQVTNTLSPNPHLSTSMTNINNQNQNNQNANNKKKGGGKNKGKTPSSPSSRSPTGTNTPIQKKKKKETIEAKRERKAAKTLAIITGAFVVCWFGFFAMALIMPLCPSCDVPDYVQSALLWLGYLNSTINPIIYTLNPEFRMAFKRILCGNRYRGRR